MWRISTSLYEDSKIRVRKHRVAALLEEIGDVQCLIDLMVRHGIVSAKGIKRRVKFKHKKLKRWSTLYD